MHTLYSPTPADFGNFGFSVAAEGGTIFIVEGDNTSGEVHLFNAATGGFLRTINSPENVGKYFADSISVAGNRLLVGAERANRGAEESGAAFLFDIDTGNLVRTFVDPTPEEDEHFGRTVAIVGDSVLIGTLAADGSSVYRFDVVTGDLLDTFRDPTPEGNSLFASAMAATEHRVFVGDRTDDAAGTNTGSVYMYEMEPSTVASTTTDSNGNYLFTDVEASDYRVVQISSPYYEQTAPDAAYHGVMVEQSDVIVDLDFGIDTQLAQDDTYAVVQDAPATLLDVLNNDLGAGLTITDFSQGSRALTVAIDGSHLEYTPVTGFVGQEALTYTMTDGMTESTATVIVTVGTPTEPYIDFDDYTILSYGGAANDVEGTATVEAEGAVLHLVGNLMKAIDRSYPVTPYTRLEFDFCSTIEGDVHAIGTDLTTEAEGVFKVYGTESGGYTELDDYAPAAPDFKHYEIHPGDIAIGDMTKLWFMNDHDVVRSGRRKLLRQCPDLRRSTRTVDGER